jgi:ATPase subunit of ABC transporter with duplicated ATPase domains
MIVDTGLLSSAGRYVFHVTPDYPLKDRRANCTLQARSHDAEESEYADEDVYREAIRVEDCEDELRVCNISKSYGDNLAVDRVAFGVPRGEIFALLGPNGAGKSTSISLIRGDVHPSAGDVFLENESIVKHRAAARLHQGVCPQFDAMDALTASEHLHFYARARGVTDVEHNVKQVRELSTDSRISSQEVFCTLFQELRSLSHFRILFEIESLSSPALSMGPLSF